MIDQAIQHGLPYWILQKLFDAAVVGRRSVWVLSDDLTISDTKRLVEAGFSLNYRSDIHETEISWQKESPKVAASELQ